MATPNADRYPGGQFSTMISISEMGFFGDFPSLLSDSWEECGDERQWPVAGVSWIGDRRRGAERREAERIEAELRESRASWIEEAERRGAERREAERIEAELRESRASWIEEAERRDAETREAMASLIEASWIEEAERREAERRLLVQLELAAWGWSGYALPSRKARRGWARLTLRFDGSREGRTWLGKSLHYRQKAPLSKLRNLPGTADPMQIWSDRGAFLLTVCRSRVECEESMQILKNPCNRYNELGSKELICETKSPFAPRSPDDSKGCNSDGQKKEDDLMTSFALVLQQGLRDALDPILVPVACELQRQGEEARKELERLLALEKQKLALNLKELERLKRRQAGRFQSSRRASPAFPRRRRQGQGHRLRFPWTPKY